MTDSSEEDIEDLFTGGLKAKEGPVSTTTAGAQSKTESFNKFVLDEVMIARAMMKNPMDSLSEEQRERALKLKEGIGSGGKNQPSFAVDNTKLPILVTSNSAREQNATWSYSKFKRQTTFDAAVKDRAQRAPRRSDGSIGSCGKKKESKNTQPKPKVNTNFEGWCVPSITRQNGMITYDGIIGQDSLQENGARRKAKKAGSPPSVQLPDIISLEEDSSDKAHAITSKPIEERVAASAGGNGDSGGSGDSAVSAVSGSGLKTAYGLAEEERGAPIECQVLHNNKVFQSKRR